MCVCVCVGGGGGGGGESEGEVVAVIALFQLANFTLGPDATFNTKYIKIQMPHQLLTFSQSEYLIQIADKNSHT